MKAILKDNTVLQFDNLMDAIKLLLTHYLTQEDDMKNLLDNTIFYNMRTVDILAVYANLLYITDKLELILVNSEKEEEVDLNIDFDVDITKN